MQQLSADHITMAVRDILAEAQRTGVAPTEASVLSRLGITPTVKVQLIATVEVDGPYDESDLGLAKRAALGKLYDEGEQGGVSALLDRFEASLVA